MPTILHAEDDKGIREGFARRFKRMVGYDVVSAEDGQAAWELLCTMPTSPDIIVSDFDMPKMTGGQLLARVRADSKFATIPFTLFTATERDFDGKPLASLCAELHAHYVDKGKWDGDMQPLLRPMFG